MQALFFPGKSESTLTPLADGFAALGHGVGWWREAGTPPKALLEECDIMVGCGNAAVFRPDPSLETATHLGQQMGVPVVQLWDQEVYPDKQVLNGCHLFHKSEDASRRWTSKGREDGHLFAYLPNLADQGNRVKHLLDAVMPKHYVELTKNWDLNQEYKQFIMDRMREKGDIPKPFQIYRDKNDEISHIVTIPRIKIDRWGGIQSNHLSVANPWAKEKFPMTSTLDGLERRIEKWKRVLSWNLPRIDEYLAGDEWKKPVEQHETVYLVAPGPSLAKNGHHLKDVRHGYVIGMNKAHQIVGPDALDAYMAVDAQCPDHWFQSDFTGVTGYLSVAVAPAAGRANFGAIRWFHDEDLAALKLILGDRCGKLLTLAHGLSVLYSATDLACQMGAKNVVFVGADGSFPSGEVHPGEKIDQWGFKDCFKLKDVNGEDVLTNPLYTAITNHLIGKIVLMMYVRGIRVINATEGGVLVAKGSHREKTFEIEQRKLADVIQEFNKEA